MSIFFKVIKCKFFLLEKRIKLSGLNIISSNYGKTDNLIPLMKLKHYFFEIYLSEYYSK
jgi:hypothetical protein